MEKTQVVVVSQTGDFYCEDVGRRDYHDAVAARMFLNEVDKSFKIDNRIYGDNAASIVENYHYLVIFDSPLYTVGMFPEDATLEQKTFFFYKFYGKGKEVSIGVRKHGEWVDIEDKLEYLSDFEFKIGGKR